MLAALGGHHSVGRSSGAPSGNGLVPGDPPPWVLTPLAVGTVRVSLSVKGNMVTVPGPCPAGRQWLCCWWHIGDM
jgi:hypothetical protein